MKFLAYKDGTKVQIKLLKQTGIICGFTSKRNMVVTYDVSYNENGRYITVPMSPEEFEVHKDAVKVEVTGYKSFE